MNTLVASSNSFARQMRVLKNRRDRCIYRHSLNELAVCEPTPVLYRLYSDEKNDANIRQFNSPRDILRVFFRSGCLASLNCERQLSLGSLVTKSKMRIVSCRAASVRTVPACPPPYISAGRYTWRDPKKYSSRSHSLTYRASLEIREGKMREKRREREGRLKNIFQ